MIRKILIPLLILCGTAAPVGAAKTPDHTAVFAGGCFWCMTPPFEKLKGVVKVTAGYVDGKGADPTYGDYAEKGYTEGVRITYDPSRITYSRLLDVFWRQINPTDPNGQFVDRGPQYRAAVYYLNASQERLAEKSRAALAASGRFHKPIVVPVKKFTNFYAAEEYHQDFYKKNPIHYDLYHLNSGRGQYLDRVWGKGKH